MRGDIGARGEEIEPKQLKKDRDGDADLPIAEYEAESKTQYHGPVQEADIDGEAGQGDEGKKKLARRMSSTVVMKRYGSMIVRMIRSAGETGAFCASIYAGLPSAERSSPGVATQTKTLPASGFGLPGHCGSFNRCVASKIASSRSFPSGNELSISFPKKKQRYCNIILCFSCFFFFKKQKR
jgi:hypothetical protein